MEKFIPYEKMSKKERRALDQQRRNTWGQVRPGTRTEESQKAYKRRPKHKNQAWQEELCTK